ncbi:Hypothetical protein A7982_01925 [Minicystis rosea]|nr:Hypothetical protein A7982_01925 [Minicystis rosea]
MLGVLLCAGACRLIVGIDDRHVAGAPSCEADFVPASSSCDQCTRERCASEVTDCCADAVCSSVLGCAGKCANGDADCRARCVTAYDRQTAAISACQARSCHAECGIACGGIAGASDAGIFHRSTACADCLETKCCTAATTCGESVECLAFQGCRFQCNPFDDACRIDCAREDDAGPAVVKPLSACTLASCLTECFAGDDWSCVGHVSWPLAKSLETITVTAVVVDGFSLAPIAGATVKACFPLDTSCTSFAASEVTGSDGTARLAIAISTAIGFNGYLDVSAPGYFETLAFVAPFVTDDQTVPATLIGVDQGWSWASALGTTPQMDKGHLLVTACDCARRPAPGVSFAVEPAGGTPFYVGAAGVSGMAIETSAPYCAGGFLNLPPGMITTNAKVAGLGGLVESSSHAFIRAGALTTLSAVPTPGALP